nr:lysozyme inhibitor LprI family protein [Pseudomonas sp. KK4]
MIAVLLSASTTWAASFDCDKAAATDEKAICAHRALNDMDVKMALLFELDKRFVPMGGRDALIDQQKAWLRQRQACGARVACLTGVYQQRIETLRDIIDTRVVTHGPF